jgi:FAD/FMN-containing dehydrogenase
VPLDDLIGQVIRPGDPEYDPARRVWNAAIDRRPALIVRPRTADEVAAALGWTRLHDLPVTARAGGHSPAGSGVVEGGLVVDLRSMTQLTIDAERHIASTETGLVWEEFNGRAGRSGLTTPSGDIAAVGVAGLTLGGGFGLLSRNYGLTIDSLLDVELVSADGRVLTANAETHPDLFWAVRGGGGNFGIVTRMRFRLHPVTTVVGGAIVYPATVDVLRALVDAAIAAPDELSTLAFVMHAPPLGFLPSEHHGRHVVSILVCDSGDLETADARVRPLRALAGLSPLADATARMPYPALFELTEQAAIRRPQASRAGFLRSIGDETLEVILEHTGRPTSPFSTAMLRVLGGAVARVAADATAFAHRDKVAFLNVQNVWDDPSDSEPHAGWVEDFWQAVAAATDGAYANYLGDEGPERIRAAYPSPTYERLAAIKRRYDPDNVFRSNVNIAPAAPAVP